MSENVKTIAKPDLEYFFGKLFKGYCGNCGRLLFTGGGDPEELPGIIKTCRFCGCEVDWDG